jgi:hypothetical protein
MSDIRESALWLSEQLAVGRRAGQAMSTPQLGHSSIEAGQIEEYDAEGTLVSVTGEQFDGTHTAVTLAGPVPPEPTPPSLTVGPGQVEVRWNGLFADDALSPMDFSHVTVHAAPEEMFEPDNTTQKATITGESGDTATVLLESGEWSILLVAVSKAGKWSDPSDPVLVEVPDDLTSADTLDSLLELRQGTDSENFHVAGDIVMSGNSLLERFVNLPRGLTTWAQFPGGGQYAWPTLPSGGGEVGLFEIGWDTSQDLPARMYKVNVPNILLKSLSAQDTTMGLVMRFTDDGSAPTVTSQRITHDYGLASPGGYGSRSFNDVMIGSSNGPYIRVLVTMWSTGGCSVDTNAHLSVSVDDAGLYIEQGGSITTAGGTIATGTVTTAPAAPKVTKTVEYAHTSVRSFTGTNAFYNYNTAKGYQGLQPGTGNGNLKSLWTFPSLTTLLSGATVNEIWAYFYFEHWYYAGGGTARIVVHGNSGQPATYSDLGLAVTSGSWPRGAGRWVKIPSSLYAGFKTGTYKGFGLEGDNTYNTYGIANAARIRVKYTK